MNQLLAFDRSLFFLINLLPHTAVADWLMRGVSGLGGGGLLFVLIAVLLVLFEEKRDHMFLLPVIATGLVGTMLTDLIKIIIRRPRPFTMPGSMGIIPLPADFSFPSGHTTLAFAFAVLLSQKEPRLRIVLFAAAVIIGFSRIFLGHHYPSDVFGGAVLGLMLGYGISYAYRRFRPENRPAGTRRYRTIRRRSTIGK